MRLKRVYKPTGKGHKALFLIVLIMAVILAEAGVVFFAKVQLHGMPAFPHHCLQKPDGYDERWNCLNPYFEKLTKAASASVALTGARKLVTQGVMSDCHIAAHTIGRANLEKHDFDMGRAFATCGFACIQGCMHGVMERYVRELADPYKVRDEIADMCDSVGLAPETENPALSKDVLMWDQCNHGLGHGLLQHGFFPLEESARICISLENRHAEHRCVSGLMMENMNQYLSLDENSLREVLPHVCAPFEGMKDEEATFYLWNACIGDVALGLMFYTGHDVERSKELCEGLLQGPHVASCKASVTAFKEGRNTRITDIPF
jgi:hypothetical protein